MRTYAQTCTNMHAHTACTCAHTCTCRHADKCTDMHKHACAHRQAHMHTHAGMHTHICTGMHPHRHTHMHRHAHTHMQARTCIHRHMHAQVPMRMHVHTRTLFALPGMLRPSLGLSKPPPQPHTTPPALPLPPGSSSLGPPRQAGGQAVVRPPLNSGCPHDTDTAAAPPEPDPARPDPLQRSLSDSQCHEMPGPRRRVTYTRGGWGRRGRKWNGRRKGELEHEKIIRQPIPGTYFQGQSRPHGA